MNHGNPWFFYCKKEVIMEFRDTVVPQSPDTYVSPLPAGKSFEFVSAHTIYPYESSYGGLVDGIARNISNKYSK